MHNSFFSSLDSKSFHRLATCSALATATLFGWTSAVYAAPSSVIPARAMSAASSQTYTLGPEDVISVLVQKHREYSIDAQTVPSSGRIQVPGVGDVNVAGRTTTQVADEITLRLRRTLLRPQVTVSLRLQRTRRIFMLGSVGKTGAFDVKPGFRVTEALALAGGLMTLPDQMDGFLNRAGTKPIRLDLPEIYTNSDSPKNYVLRNGDVLQFNQRVIRINVAGKVGKPGVVNVPIGEGIVQAISLAGGATTDAALSRVVVRRNSKEMPVDLYNAIIKGQGEDKFKLMSGDLIIVPEALDRISVLGAVIKQGYYDIPDGNSMRVSEALGLASGPGPRAALSRAVVRHASGPDTPVDLYRVLVEGSQDGNITLKSGDSVVVPESRGVTIIGAVPRPGTFYVEEAKTPRLSDILAQSGGLAIKPETARISISRSSDDGSKPFSLEIDPVALLVKNSWSQNAVVKDGDVITVSGIQGQTVFVSGEVKTSGAFELRESDGLQALLARAGGVTPMASLRQVTVTHRDGQVQMVDILDSVKNGTESPVKLRDGDYIVVPQNMNRVLVMAAVQRPGMYPLPEDRPLSVGEALALAGGPLDRAKLKEVAILHQTPQGIQRRILPLNSAQNAATNSNITLSNGDIVYVPAGGAQSTSGWDMISRGVGLFSLFSGL